MDYYSPFWGRKAISMVVEPQGVLMCWSSTLAVLADSGPFHGLLLTVLGSQSDFHGCRNPRCDYVLVINNHSMGRFLPVSWTITQFWGTEVISRIDEPQGAFKCRSSTLAVLVDSCPSHGLLLTVLAPRAISTIDEHQGAFTCRSATLAVLADSGPYHGLLLSVLVSHRDFHGL